MIKTLQKVIEGTCVCVLNTFNFVQLCATMNCSLPGSSVYGILQARILERVAIGLLYMGFIILKYPLGVVFVV